MPRTARVVIAGIPHHVTQRGDRRLATFFSGDDDAADRSSRAESCRTANDMVPAYCLMPNHVHLVLVPAGSRDLATALAGWDEARGSGPPKLGKLALAGRLDGAVGVFRQE